MRIIKASSTDGVPEVVRPWRRIHGFELLDVRVRRIRLIDEFPNIAHHVECSVGARPFWHSASRPWAFGIEFGARRIGLVSPWVVLAVGAPRSLLPFPGQGE